MVAKGNENESEGLETLGTMKMMLNVRRVSSHVKRELNERVLSPTVKYGAETWGMRMN